MRLRCLCRELFLEGITLWTCSIKILLHNEGCLGVFSLFWSWILDSHFFIAHGFVFKYHRCLLHRICLSNYLLDIDMLCMLIRVLRLPEIIFTAIRFICLNGCLQTSSEKMLNCCQDPQWLSLLGRIMGIGIVTPHPLNIPYNTAIVSSRRLNKPLYRSKFNSIQIMVFTRPGNKFTLQ